MGGGDLARAAPVPDQVLDAFARAGPGTPEAVGLRDAELLSGTGEGGLAGEK